MDFALARRSRNRRLPGYGRSGAALVFLAVVIVATHSASAQSASGNRQLNRLRILQEQTPAVRVIPADDRVTVAVGSAMNFTDNADLAGGAKRADFYSTALAGVRIDLPLAGELALGTGLLATNYQYIRNPDLSIAYADWDVGVFWNPAEDRSAYLTHTLEGTEQSAFDDVTITSIIALGGAWTRQLAPAHTVTIEPEASVTAFAVPFENNYQCLSASLTYTWQIAPAVRFSAWTTAYTTFYFTGENDATVNVAASVSLAITRWLNATAAAREIWNFSNTSGSNYTAVDVGVAINARWEY